MPKEKNPIIEIYKGVKIRRCNFVAMKFGIVQFKKILDEVDRTGLSIHKILAYSGKPCERCNNTMVIVYDKNGEVQKIKRGILSVPEGNGINIIEHARNKLNGKEHISCKANK